MTPEGRVKKKVRDLLKQYHCWYCMPVAGPYGRNGVPDVLVCCKGQFLAIECKAGNNGPTELQQACMLQIADARGTAMVINEANLHVLDGWLKVVAA